MSSIAAPLAPPKPGLPLVADAFGGLGAMLVAMPSAIAFGLLTYAPLGGSVAAQGALTGIFGTVVLGIVAALFGGAPRLISAPCAPAAAVLSAFSAALVGGAAGARLEPAQVVLLLGLVGLAAGVLQLAFGAAGGGRLIKYIPFPVVSGYLSAVGVLIFLSQLPKLFGLAKGVTLAHGLATPGAWQWPALVVGGASVAAMLAAPRVSRRVPAPVLALAAAVLAYLALAALGFAPRTLEGNPFVIGALGGEGASPLAPLTARWAALPALSWRHLAPALVPALTLSVLLSIDTLKTCVVVDALTRSRHDSNRELRGQGLGNIASALLGGMPGAGTMGATLVNLTGGGHTRLSGVFAGAFALLAFVLLGSFIAWVPVAGLAGILLVVAVRMFDPATLALARHRSTRLDFLVVAAVVVAALALDLVSASGVGFGLAILLFVRDQIRGSVVRRKALGNQLFSKTRRLPADLAVLEKEGARIALFELQGSLFFGTTDQLYGELAPHLGKESFVILDLHRVQSVDFTAAHLFEQVEAQLGEAGGWLIFANLPPSLPTGQDLRRYFGRVGLVGPERRVRIAATRDDALAFAEDQLIAASGNPRPPPETALALEQIDVFAGLPDGALQALAACVRERPLQAGAVLFHAGDRGDELFLIRRGSIRVQLPLAGGRALHLATFGQGDAFGDMAFIDRDVRSADAVAQSAADLFVVSRSAFDRACEAFPLLGQLVFARLARTLALRLRITDRELQLLLEA